MVTYNTLSITGTKPRHLGLAVLGRGQRADVRCGYANHQQRHLRNLVGINGTGT
jgi:hypothetical protein